MHSTYMRLCAEYDKSPAFSNLAEIMNQEETGRCLVYRSVQKSCLKTVPTCGTYLRVWNLFLSKLWDFKDILLYNILKYLSSSKISKKSFK